MLFILVLHFISRKSRVNLHHLSSIEFTGRILFLGIIGKITWSSGKNVRIKTIQQKQEKVKKKPSKRSQRNKPNKPDKPDKPNKPVKPRKTEGPVGIMRGGSLYQCFPNYAILLKIATREGEN